MIHWRSRLSSNLESRAYSPNVGNYWRVPCSVVVDRLFSLYAEWPTKKMFINNHAWRLRYVIGSIETGCRQCVFSSSKCSTIKKQRVSFEVSWQTFSIMFEHQNEFVLLSVSTWPSKNNSNRIIRMYDLLSKLETFFSFPFSSSTLIMKSSSTSKNCTNKWILSMQQTNGIFISIHYDRKFSPWTKIIHTNKIF